MSQSHSPLPRVWSWRLCLLYLCAEHIWLFNFSDKPSAAISPLSPFSWLSSFTSFLFQPCCCSLLVAEPAAAGQCLSLGQLACLCY